jgi:gliding motility-associated-like protein
MLLLVILSARASHLLGGEMSYRYLDANGPVGHRYRYELTVGMYINADTVPGSATQSQVPTGRSVLRVGIYQKGGALNGEALELPVLPKVSMRFATPQPAPGCPPTTPVRLIVYRDTVALPFSAEGYYAYVTDGTRNAGIRNIDQPTHHSENENLTLFLDMAPPTLPNSSPTFADTAVALICQGDTAIIINNANDVDGDRLSYAFAAPYSATPAGVNNVPPAQFTPPPVLVQYAPGYSVAQPFGMATGNIAQLDATTGLSSYCAVNQGRYVVAVDVSEYRTINGTEVLVGRTRRDVQLVVRLCPAGASPRLSAPALVPRSYSIEEGESLTFPIDATTSIAGEVLTLKVNSALLDGPSGLGATYNNNPGTVAAGQTTGIVALQAVGAVGGNFQLNSLCGSARATPYYVLATASSRDCRKKTASDIFRITITKAIGPSHITGDSLICDPSQVYTYATAGPVLGTYQWMATGGSIVGADTSRTVQVRWAATPAGAALRLRGWSRFGCPVDSLVRSVAVSPPVPLVVSGGLSICPGGSTLLTVTGGTGPYTLTGGGQVLTGAGPFMVAPAATTVYAVAGTPAAGCPLTSTVTVAVVPAPVLTVSGRFAVCSGTSTSLTVAGGVGSYTLTGGGQTLSVNSSFTLSPATTTAYAISGYTAAGCPATATFTVQVELVAAPSVAVSEMRICEGMSTTITAQGGTGRYTLSGGGQVLSGVGPFVIAPASTTTYALTSTSAGGCTSVTDFIIRVVPCTEPDVALKFYNIITPNHDDKNDAFVIENVTNALYTGNSLTIFNRWGREVFRTTNYQNDWGRDPDTAPGVYGYLFRLPSGQVTKGWLEIVR